MKQPDKFLIAIVTVLVLLVIAAFAIVLLSPPPQYRAGESAEDIVYNYLLALQQEDYQRALDLISVDVPNRPQDAAEMAWDISQEKWQFERFGSPALAVTASRISGDSATVTISETRSNGALLDSPYTEEVTMRLKKEVGGWKLIEGQAYWYYQWTNEQN